MICNFYWYFVLLNSTTYGLCANLTYFHFNISLSYICMVLCLTILGSFYLGIFCCTRFYLIFWGLPYCFNYVNSKLLRLNPGVLEWERISLQSFYLDYVVVAYQIDRSNWPESCILCTFVSICVSGVIVQVTDCFSFICL